MSELVEQAKSLGIEVNPEWSEQYIKRMITMAKNGTEQKTEPKAELFPIRLLKNYRPSGDYEVVGYHRPEKVQKDSAGKQIIVQPAAFIEGEMAPPPYPGVGFETKVWAETVLRLPLEEAKRLVNRNLAVRADALPG